MVYLGSFDVFVGVFRSEGGKGSVFFRLVFGLGEGFFIGKDSEFFWDGSVGSLWIVNMLFFLFLG